MSAITVDLQSGQPTISAVPHKQFSGTIPAGQSVVVDSIALTEFSRLNYELSFFNDAETITKSFTFTVRKQNTTVRDQVFARLGTMDISADSQVNAGEYNLVIANSEAFVVNYCLTVLTS